MNQMKSLKNGKRKEIKMKINIVDIALEILELGYDNEGICRKCGEIQYGVEPDAEGYECEACGAMEVAGAEQIILMMG